MWRSAQLGSLVILASVLPTLAGAPTQEREPIREKKKTEGEEEKKLAEVKGRFVLPDGTPAAGAAVQFHGAPSNSENVVKYGMPDNWKDVTTQTDENGRFAFAIGPPRAFQFSLDVKLSGYAAAHWRWFQIDPGQVVDVGEIWFIRGGTIVGRMVDPKGEPVGGRWRVRAEGVRPSGERGRDAAPVIVSADPETGRFRLEDALPGSTQLRAKSPIANWVNGPTIDVVAGEVVEANIVYSGPDNSSRIVVIPFSHPFYIFEPAEKSIHLIGPDGTRRTPSLIARSSQSYAFDNLEPGSYAVEIDDPRYMLWSRTEVQIGSRVEAMLKGNAAIRLVLTAEDGTHVERYRMNVRYLSTQSHPNVFPILDAREAPPRGGNFDGFIPGTLVLEIEAPGCAPLDVRVGDLKAHEARRVDAKLSPGVDLTGIVYEADGSTPAGGAAVSLRKKREQRTRHEVFPDERGKKVLAQATTDENGRFTFERVAHGPRTVVASANAYVRTVKDVVVGDEPADISVSLPASATLTGRLVVPEGIAFEGLELGLAPTAEASWSGASTENIVLAIGADGSFAAERLPLGKVRLLLSAPERQVPHGFSSIRISRPSFEVARFELSADSTPPREIDLRERWPGSLRVTVLKRGRPAPGMVVEAHGSAHGPVPGSSAAATTDAEGVASLEFLAPGEWTFHVRPAEGGWRHGAPDTVTVKSAQEGEHRIEVEIVRGALRVVDATTGEPVAGRRIRVWLEGKRTGPVYETDTEGQIQLELPVGTYTIADGVVTLSSGPAKIDTVDWTARGPSKDEVSISLEVEWKPQFEGR